MKETLTKIASLVDDLSRIKKLSGPWQIGDWAVATDGVVILFSKGCDGIPVLPEDSELRPKLLKYFDPSTGGCQVEIPALKEFAGPVEWLVPCPACEGLSKKSEYVSCSLCDGAGQCAPYRPGFLFEKPVNRIFLARLLSEVTEATARLVIGPNRPDKKYTVADAIYIVGENWRAVLMAMSKSRDGDQSEEWANAPRFPEKRS